LKSELNMKKTFIHIILSAALLGSFASCKKQLELEPRQSQEVDEALSTREGINASILGVYARLKSTANYGKNLLAVSEALSDNATFTNKSGRLVNENQNIAGAHFTHYQNAYYAIAQINQTLAAIPSVNASPAVTVAERNSWEGQLYFLRALYYHDLARAYGYEPGMGVQGQDRGAVPVVLATPATPEGARANQPARSTADSVYRRIYMDLTTANNLLPTSNTGYPYIATKVAAQALFARVALYNRDWARAEAWADSVLTRSYNATAVNGMTTAANHVTSGWTGAQNSESLFEVRFVNPAENIGVNESLQTSYTTLVQRGNLALLGGFGDLVPAGVSGTSGSGLLWDLGFRGYATNGSGGTFTSRTDDVRNLLFERGHSGRGTARIECTKFLGKSGTINLDNVPVIRMAEIYLIRSEARLNQGNSTGALADLVFLKQRRYTDYANTQATFDAGLTATIPAPGVIPAANSIYGEILRQRRIEFAFEGHRWFDFKRLGLTLPKATSTAYAGYTDFKVLPSIPQREVDLSPNMVQNFGY
jgi:starch-binding outer membrane protein, SusD/RagB family